MICPRFTIPISARPTTWHPDCGDPSCQCHVARIEHTVLLDGLIHTGLGRRAARFLSRRIVPLARSVF